MTTIDGKRVLSDLGARVKALRIAKGLSQDDLAIRCGYANRGSIAKIEAGKADFPKSRLIRLAKALNTTPIYLLGAQDSPDMAKIPVLGEVITGLPVDAVEECIGYEEIPTSLANTGDFFALRVKGDSMEPRIAKGDHLIVRKQDSADSGDIVIASIAEDLATCKQLIFIRGGISLISFNPSYKPLTYTYEEVRSLPIRILGKVIENRQKYE